MTTTDQGQDREDFEGETTLTRDLPKLRQFLSTKADGFDEWAAMTFFAEHAVKNGTDKAGLRLLRLLLVATVEGLNNERAHGRDDRDSILMLARLMGYVASTAVASVLDDTARLRGIVRAMTEEFKRGGKMAADSIFEEEQSNDR